MRTVTSLAAEILERHGAATGRSAEVVPAGAGRRRGSDRAAGQSRLPRVPVGHAYAQLVELPRYLRAARLRIDTLLATPARDRPGFEVISRCEDAYAALVRPAATRSAAGAGGGDRLAARGAPGQPVRPSPAHADAGVGEAGDGGHRRRPAESRLGLLDPNAGFLAVSEASRLAGDPRAIRAALR